MAQTWPATLQQLLNRDSFSLQKQDTKIRTNVETGPIKSRRRFSAPQIKMNCQIWVNDDVYSDWVTFFDTTLEDGNLTFDFDHPITGVSMEWRIVGTPAESVLGALTYKVDMVWESV